MYVTLSPRGTTHNASDILFLKQTKMTLEQLVPGTDYLHMPSIREPGTKLSTYTFIAFNKVGNCIWKVKDSLQKSEIILTLYYTLQRFKII